MCRCPGERRSREGWRPGLVVCMFFFWQAFVRDAFYSLQCLESVLFPLQSVSFHCRSASVFAWKPEGMGQPLWPCESTLKAWSKRGGGCGPSRHNSMSLQTHKDRHVCWQPFIRDRRAKQGSHGWARVLDDLISGMFEELLAFLGGLIWLDVLVVSQQQSRGIFFF